MPELPEVETIRLGLEEHIVGKKIVSVEVRLKKIISGDIAKITGAKFKKIRRFGKILLAYAMLAKRRLLLSFPPYDR